MEGKEKANGRPGTARATAAEDRADRSQVRQRGPGRVLQPGAVSAAGALFRRGVDQRDGGRDLLRRAFRDREALPTASAARQHGYLDSDRIAGRPARFAFGRYDPAVAPEAMGI